ncbi:hypothetical protein [Flavobacterium sp. W20_MBD1_R3]|uniref:hypothetical protein n=1 Tax=Flavobacterium sp. W20_MBD1_R3 TaxID=3240278 RepID=UPI003F9374E8
MPHITIDDLAINPNSKSRIFKHKKYLRIKKSITACIRILLALVLLLSCKSEPKKQSQQRQILQNHTHRKYDDDELEVKIHTLKTKVYKKTTNVDSLFKKENMYFAYPMQIPIEFSSKIQQPKNSSGQRKGKIIYTSKSKTQNQWKQY